MCFKPPCKGVAASDTVRQAREICFVEDMAHGAVCIDGVQPACCGPVAKYELSVGVGGRQTFQQCDLRKVSIALFSLGRITLNPPAAHLCHCIHPLRQVCQRLTTVAHSFSHEVANETVASFTAPWFRGIAMYRSITYRFQGALQCSGAALR